jgi:PilZ domain-containing protein
MSADRRKSFRVEWNEPATIHDGGMARPCILANFSNTGAKLTKVVPATIPDEFMLSITPHGRKRKCRVRWRYGEAVGVEFTDRADMEQPDIGAAMREPAE